MKDPAIEQKEQAISKLSKKTINIFTTQQKQDILGSFSDFTSVDDSLFRPIKSFITFTPEQIEKKIHSFTNIFINEGYTTDLIEILIKDMDFEANKKKFLNLVQQRYPEDATSMLDIIQALHIAETAHHRQVNMRPRDTKGTDFLPYVNHSIAVASLALQAGLSPQIIKAALLHDVIEDTTYSKEKLQQQIDPMTMDYVDIMTQNEPKEQYFDRIKHSPKEIIILKCLDRLHNLIRSFAIQDPDYSIRYAYETQKNFGGYFHTFPELKNLEELFSSLIQVIKTHHSTKS